MSGRCGSTETTTGEPCRFPSPVNCPHHRGPGRPTKYRPECCEKVIELGRKGKSRAVMARELGVAMSTMQDWEKNYPRFRAATARARELAQAWWEDQGQMGVWAGSDFNASAYRLQMMNRFPSGWRDRRELKHSGEVKGGDVHVYLPSNSRDERQEDELPEAVRERIAGNGARSR